MRALTTPQELAGSLDVSTTTLLDTLHRADDLYDILIITNPQKPDKPRSVVSPRGRLRELQRRFLNRVLKPILPASKYNHGGVPGRSILTHCRQHIRNRFIYTTDIAAFFPSIRKERVVELFLKLGYSKDVAGLCTILCTCNYRLEQGLITSPILANHLMRPVDNRIANTCRSMRLTYSRFVDDLAISGNHDIEECGIGGVITKILQSYNFDQKTDAKPYASIADGPVHTGLKLAPGHLDVRNAYIEQLTDRIDFMMRLSLGEAMTGLYFTEEQLRGQVAFVCWVNPQRRRELQAKFLKINWKTAMEAAIAHRLVASTIRVTRSAWSAAPSSKMVGQPNICETPVLHQQSQ